MVLLYGTSTLYHALNGRSKKILRKLDHLAIYILIVGILIDLLPNKNGRRTIPIVIYLLMGWMALFLAKPLLENLPVTGFVWMVCGGLFYTFGLIFHGLDDRVGYFHAIWHLFVLAGSFFHFLTSYQFIA